MKSYYSDGTSMKKYFEAINGISLLSPDEELDLAMKKCDGDEKAAERIVNSNLRLVVKIAKNYTSLEPSLIDLIQEGNLGLIRAAQKFDYKMGCRFSTYASYWIKHYITRFIAKKSRTIRVPIRKGELFRKIKRASELLFSKLGRVPTDEEIGNILGVDKKNISDIMELFQPTVSLEYPLNNNEFRLFEIVGDEKNSSPDQSIYNDDLRNELEEAMDSLMENERKILRMRFGFDDDRVITLKEVGNKFGISAETVRQIEARAIEKIRQKYMYLQDYLD